MSLPYPAAAVVKRDPLNVEAPPAALNDPRPRNDEFYIRTNFGVPRLAASGYALRLRSLGGAEHRMSLDELRALGTVEIPVTLECAGNHRSSSVPLPPGETWRGGAVSTASWTGVPLRRVLEHCDMLEGAKQFLFTGADGGLVSGGRQVTFQRALSADAALGRGAEPLLAFAMNGAALPAEHGAPLRLVVPGWYAMASVKWLTCIEAIADEFAGYFQAERYVYRVGSSRTPVSHMLVKSIITAPLAESVIQAAPTTVVGWAWSGAAPVERVEVALGGGDDWQLARLSAQASRWAWRRWEFDWTPDAPGHYILRSRAADASGAAQPDVAAWNELGYGNNAIQTHSVFVR
jgi:DMSO/TMAO reductase YedYZ molybdopterin-dependent catalytic subunit